VLRASWGKEAPQKSCHKAIYFISQILGSKTHQKSKQKPNLNKHNLHKVRKTA
jgi:hypothetical protein